MLLLKSHPRHLIYLICCNGNQLSNTILASQTSGSMLHPASYTKMFGRQCILQLHPKARRRASVQPRVCLQTISTAGLVSAASSSLNASTLSNLPISAFTSISYLYSGAEFRPKVPLSWGGGLCDMQQKVASPKLGRKLGGLYVGQIRIDLPCNKLPGLNFGSFDLLGQSRICNHLQMFLVSVTMDLSRIREKLELFPARTLAWLKV
jgi:hypothetical protein